MKRLLAPLAVAAVTLAPGVADANAKTKIYRGTFQDVGAVQLVDGQKNDHLIVHVRRLEGKAKYMFRLESASKACAADAPGGTPDTAWTYRRGGMLKTSRKGVANAKATARGWSPTAGRQYSVAVYRTTTTGGQGELALCAKLNLKSKKAKHDKPKHGSGNAQDKQRGKSDDAPGHNKDKKPEQA